MGEFKNWMIKKLGGITKVEHESFRARCEEFSRKHLRGRAQLTCYGHGNLHGVELHSAIAIIGSDAVLSNVKTKELLIAPWVKGSLVTASWGGESGYNLDWEPPFISHAAGNYSIGHGVSIDFTDKGGD